MGNFKEYKDFQLPQIAEELLEQWKTERCFERSVELREGKPSFVFYEGPPSANGMPGIHHVMARTIKDLFCRYKTQKGFKVLRKAGWDTHGLPVELSVEKELGITKEDIGKKISVEKYNNKCREAVMRYTDVWNDLTEKMGYWVDMSDPYITYTPKYMESVWWLLKKLYDDALIYKGYTIQPYSPKAGTGLSSHELNMPGAYRDVKDTTVIAQFQLSPESREQLSMKSGVSLPENTYFLAWTTTPWTLPSNTALAVGENIDYVLIDSFNQYTGMRQMLVMASNLVSKYFSKEQHEQAMSLDSNPKKMPYRELFQLKGIDLLGLTYQQLLPFATPMEDADKAFRVISGDFVSTEDGTGIVHIAPTFGADDMRVARAAGVPPMLVPDKNGNPVPLVDLQGKFLEELDDIGGKYVKNEYYSEGQAPDKSVDVEIAIRLKEENKAFLVEKYEHSYPHCWRTDKPILYYPLDSWFVKASAKKERMVALNNSINWKPKATGSGRFGNWLENLNDWNLSRSRYWGIPLPIWSNEDGSELKVIGSIEELKLECERAVEAGVMKQNPLEDFVPGDMSKQNYANVDLHRHSVDSILLVSDTGQILRRESDLIDVWFDSGSMPYAQWHYPFENTDKFLNAFPADFIAEGVDQTRGWFYTLHAIAAMTHDSVAYKNVVSNGLVLDKTGQKMSKRLGNAVDPFATMKTYGADATRWYMITNAQPWDNLKFDEEGIVEVQRKFFRALQNTYAFLALYANVDGFSYKENDIPLHERPEIDRWILSKLNSLIREVDDAYADYEPTKAGRLIQNFVVDDLSNWYVRLCRKRFWRGDYGPDKIAAYQSLFTCLKIVAQLSAPIAPFYMDRLYRNLSAAVGDEVSVHHSDFPQSEPDKIDDSLEERMGIAQQLSSMILSLRKKENIRVRQPLQRMMVPVLSSKFKAQLEAVEDLILTEVNVKELEYLSEDNGILVKKIKPDFKQLGPRFGKNMKLAAQAISQMNADDIRSMESNGSISLQIDGQFEVIQLNEVEIISEDIPGCLVQTENGLTVALDISISEDLRAEGIARELVNRIQNLRKDKGLEVTDRINIRLGESELIRASVETNLDYICSETLADRIETGQSNLKEAIRITLEEGIQTELEIIKI